MKRTILLLVIPLLVLAPDVFAQSEKKAVREGNQEFRKGEYLDSEISYRSAIEINPLSFKGNFNLGDALYKQEKFEEAAQVFDDLSNLNIDPKSKASVYHNLGNAHFKQQSFSESVEAYKNALRHYPNDMETKYNLAQAQRMLLQQEQQNQDNDGESDSKNDSKEDKQQDKSEERDEDQNQQNKEDQKQKQEQQITPEDARRMLEAIQNNEQEIQDRVREEQAKQAKIKVEKNW